MIHTFRFSDLYIIHDVESGAVHSVSREAYDVVNAQLAGKDPYELDIERGEVDEILKELKELKELGYLDTEEPKPAGAFSKSAIKSMCLHIAHDCNLRCKYCFGDAGEYHGERSLMSIETAKKALDFLIERSGNRHNLEVDLFGGEPLMNMDTVKAAVSYGRELEKKYDKHINFTMTTNGMLLSDEIIDYLNEEMHNIVISLDGRKEIHDALRPTANGKSSYDTIAKNAQKLIKKRKGEYYIRGTFTNRNLDFTEDVKAMRELGFDSVSIEPVVLDESSPYALKKEHLPEIFKEYEHLAEYMLEEEKAGHGFTFFHFMIDLSHGPCLKKRISGCGAGVEYAAIAPNGDIYPCHQFVGDGVHKMGNVFGDFDESIGEEFAGCNILTKEKCKSCFAKYFCSGGCAANAYKYNGSIMKPHELTCELLKKRTECAIGMFVKERE